MSTDIYDQLARVLDRYDQADGHGQRETRAVTAAARQALADPDFRHALERLLRCDPDDPSVGRLYRDLASPPADVDWTHAEILERLTCGSPESDALDDLLTAAAGADTECHTSGPSTEKVVAAILAAVLIERSSLGDSNARTLRNQTTHRDAAAAVKSWRLLAERGPAHHPDMRGTCGARNSPDRQLEQAGEPLRRDTIEPLTQREKEVLERVARLMSNAEIANELFISVGTVKTHLKSVSRKLAVVHPREAVRRARWLKLI